MAKRDAGSALRKAQAEIVSLKNKVQEGYDVEDALNSRLCTAHREVQFLNERIVMDAARLHKAERHIKELKVVAYVLVLIIALLTKVLLWPA